MLDRLLVFSVFIVASCGLAYELIAGAMSSYLLGDSLLQFSSVIGCYLFAMGIGSHCSKYIKDEDALSRFIDIELLIGLIGGISALILFAVFAWLSSPFRSVLYALVLLIGMGVGMEIPLVMRVLDRQQLALKDLVSRVLTFDYLGALAVSLLFPLVLAPHLGMIRTGLLFGIFNVLIALWTAHCFQAQIKQVTAKRVRGGVILGGLILAFVSADQLTKWAEKGLFGDETIFSHTSPYQRLVVTQWKDDLRLYINGNLQFSSKDEHRYHESLVHPLLSSQPWAKRVLVLGGGDGLAVREILKYPNIKQVVLVDLDPEMTKLFSTAERLVKLNQHSLTNPRVKVFNQDAGQWLESNTEMFDAIIVDFPDPSNYALGKLYSVPMFELMQKHLAWHGRLVVQSTSPYFAPRSYWCIDATLKEAGLNTWPYHTYVPSFGEWGYILAGKTADFVPPNQYAIPLRYLDPVETKRMFSFPADMKPMKMIPNRLDNQSLVHYFEQDWHQVIR
ncbi:polyamine aminopropyltransferase [Leeia sp. TBRC 13508]|uniref:Polyamine aminopropyltransferase n=1 Tax=Leeia speluncae TaxID=2884804 RepID=A0ABS8D4P3_9NEIS|nr:polyamine aminopropyltransferase [Leeia speluncae]MCB6183179.1 polyamine aminopropyltransferase [Leeia speluncae]